MKYRKINIEKIKTLSEEIVKALEELYSYSKLSENEFLSNKTVLNAAKYSFIVAIQGVIDLCHHIVARLYGKVPDEYGECFLILKDKGMIDTEFAVKLKTMAGFRNILIHLYHEVDDRRVYKHLTEDVWIIEKFLEVIRNLVAGIEKN